MIFTTIDIYLYFKAAAFVAPIVSAVSKVHDWPSGTWDMAKSFMQETHAAVRQRSKRLQILSEYCEYCERPNLLLLFSCHFFWIIVQSQHGSSTIHASV